MLYNVKLLQIAGLLLASAIGGCAGITSGEQPVAVKILAINDFHGHIQPSAESLLVGGASLRAGGTPRLATLVERFRAANPNLAFVSAGDLIGATPLISAFFDDEPTIEAMNLMGLDFNGVGNHEFDGGIAHLRRMQDGGCPPGGCKSGSPFGGAKFRMLAANVIVSATGKPLMPAYGVKEFGGVKVGFIGLTLRQTPLISSPRSVAGLDFRDEVETINALVPELRGHGIQAIAVLIHQGGVTSGGYNECKDLRGPIVAIAQQLHEAVDVIISGHTHQAYVCNLGGKLLTSAGSYGRLITEIDLKIDPVRHAVISAAAVNHVVGADMPANGDQLALIERYSKLAEPLERVVGRVTGAFSRRTDDHGESPLGQMIADSQLAATAGAGALVAFMNPGGIRAPLEPRGDGTVTFADVYAVYPFANTLITMTLTGAQILRLLENQWRRQEGSMLQVSKGFGYSWDPVRPVGSRVIQESVTIQGRPLHPETSYRITVNSFIAGGGDGLKVLLEGRDRVVGPTSRDALIRYIEQQSPLTPVGDRRVRKIGSDG